MKLRQILYEITLSDLDKKYKGKYFHGSPDISYLKSVNDIDPKKAFRRVTKSPYFFIAVDIHDAIKYANKRSNGNPKSGIGIFDLNKSKQYVLDKPEDLKIVGSSWENYMKFLAGLKKQGINSVSVPDHDNGIIIILNKNILTLLDVIYLKDIE